ncbi:hypothetical protein [Clostridium sp. BJN0013]|uniref:hypothetical protein n=1 Tax=Clostridium sp. BJN0013 TaxID=3236840 RepID=UPI0034C6DCF9
MNLIRIAKLKNLTPFVRVEDIDPFQGTVAAKFATETLKGKQWQFRDGFASM